MADPNAGSPSALPLRPIQRLTRPFVRFLHVQSASGVLLALTTVAALVIANSSAAEPYARFWDQHFRIGVGGAELSYPLWYWINDALMAVFFFVIGLEVKRELVVGELRDPRRVVLPVAAAVGGALVPVGIYLLLQRGGPGESGWAIPMATDIAFVVGCLAVLGDRVPRGLKVFMLSLAIVDDILAIGVIALVYTSGIKVGWAVGTLVGLALTAAFNRLGVRSVAVYVVVGMGVWLCSLKSGIHPTVAGVALGLLTPARAWMGDSAFVELVGQSAEALRREGPESPERRTTVSDLAFASREAVSPLVRLETGLHPWVAFGIMPVFALVNAAVPVSVSSATDAVAVAVAAGLVVGKPAGILAACALCVRLGVARLPAGVTWPILTGAAWLGGIGFTMALFIAALGLSGEPLVAAKAGVLVGSVISMAVGVVILVGATRANPPATEANPSTPA